MWDCETKLKKKNKKTRTTKAHTLTYMKLESLKHKLISKIYSAIEVTDIIDHVEDDLDNFPNENATSYQVPCSSERSLSNERTAFSNISTIGSMSSIESNMIF